MPCHKQEVEKSTCSNQRRATKDQLLPDFVRVHRQQSPSCGRFEQASPRCWTPSTPPEDRRLSEGLKAADTKRRKTDTVLSAPGQQPAVHAYHLDPRRPGLIRQHASKIGGADVPSTESALNDDFGSQKVAAPNPATIPESIPRPQSTQTLNGLDDCHCSRTQTGCRTPADLEVGGGTAGQPKQQGPADVASPRSLSPTSPVDDSTTHSVEAQRTGGTDSVEDIAEAPVRTCEGTPSSVSSSSLSSAARAPLAGCAVPRKPTVARKDEYISTDADAEGRVPSVEKNCSEVQSFVAGKYTERKPREEPGTPPGCSRLDSDYEADVSARRHESQQHTSGSSSPDCGGANCPKREVHASAETLKRASPLSTQVHSTTPRDLAALSPVVATKTELPPGTSVSEVDKGRQEAELCRSATLPATSELTTWATGDLCKLPAVIHRTATVSHPPRRLTFRSESLLFVFPGLPGDSWLHSGAAWTGNTYRR